MSCVQSPICAKVNILQMSIQQTLSKESTNVIRWEAANDIAFVFSFSPAQLKMLM